MKTLATRIKELEKQTQPKPDVFIIAGYRQIDELDERILNPNTELIFVTLEGENEQAELESAIEQKKTALQTGTIAPLFAHMPLLPCETWAT